MNYKKKDFYFDDIISNQGDKGYSYGGILINHLKGSLKDDIKKIAYNKNNYILNNFLNYKTELKFIFDQIKVLIKLLSNFICVPNSGSLLSAGGSAITDKSLNT